MKNCIIKIHFKTVCPGSVPTRTRFPGISGRSALTTVSFLLTATFLLAFPLRAEASGRAFAYTGLQYVITAEPAGERSFVVNFINLSDFVSVVLPGEFIYKGSSGRFYIGQVFEKPHKNTRGETLIYDAKALIQSRSYVGLTVLGAFREQDAIQEMSVRIGAKRYYMSPLDKIEFEKLAARIAEIDLENPSPRAALMEAAIEEMGEVTSTDGTRAWDRDWEGLIGPDGVNPPKIIESPPVIPTEEAVRTGTYGVVRLSATITRDGAIQNLTVVKGLGRGLDERAVEAVKNSWKFLPATRNGEVLETVIRFDVPFVPPDPPKPDR